ncbi:Gp19/Gp15/Gp42 family protein [Actinotignum urinale]|uniref:Gp19/Gp15/Gp42 family protein n=1 Tax=Actinotignum urinale TaxID=190146 RepID=UPI0003B7A2C3|nr:Gp19/Gp15/Gp42 family protein [Actinotignum urinale]MDY5159565.1 Gp19/Gp15/Gp42 family protein [Actinotignum urinale]
MAFATVKDVEKRFGAPLDAIRAQQVEAWLDDVVVVIQSRIPAYYTRVHNGIIQRRTAILVECRAVLRKLANPDGKTSEQIDDYSYRLSADYARGEIFLTDEEWALLDPSLGETASSAFSISTIPDRKDNRLWFTTTGRSTGGDWSPNNAW